MRHDPAPSLAALAVLTLAAACGRTSQSPVTTRNDDGTSPVASDASIGATSDATGLPQFACDAVKSQQFDATYMRAYNVAPDVSDQVESTLRLMSPAQKASQMLGVDGTNKAFRDIHRSPDVDVPGVGLVRGYRYRDAGRGVNLDQGQDNRPDDQSNYSTVFPTPSLRAASWDLELEKRIGAAIGDETAASKNNVLLAPCMNTLRHPYWGRSQETYGEDSYHIGRMATAFTVGLQEYIMACAKHFAANNVEKDRASQNAMMTEQTLREVYGRHFEMVIQDGGIGCVMAAYNSVNGTNSPQNEHLLRDMLRGPVAEGGMGFEGLVLTDWWALPGGHEAQDAATAQAVALEALKAGTDIELPWTLHYSEATLANADQSLVEESARRVLTQKYRFKSALDTDDWSIKPTTSTLNGGSLATHEVHEALAEEAVVKSAVLLANGLGESDPVLPLKKSAEVIAVVGPDQKFEQVASSTPTSCRFDPNLGAGHVVTWKCTFHFARDPALGDRGSSRVEADPSRAVGPFAGMREIAGSERTVTSGNSPEAAASADAVVVVVGYTPGDEGEEYYIASGGDRSSLDLPPGHNEFVSSVLDLDKPTVIIIESGSVVNLPWLTHSNRQQATVWAGYPGLRGGLGLAKLLLGRVNFSGKMPVTWPQEDQLPLFKDTELETTMGYFSGYRDYDKRQYVDATPVDLVFPFGHGLSYSSFEYSNLSVPCQAATAKAIIEVTVDITNTSPVDGDEVAMLFVKPPPKPADVTGERPWKELKSFARVTARAGKTVTATLPLRLRDLRRWEGGQDGRWVVDSGEYTLLVGKNAADAETTTNRARLMVGPD